MTPARDSQQFEADHPQVTVRCITLVLEKSNVTRGTTPPYGVGLPGNRPGAHNP